MGVVDVAKECINKMPLHAVKRDIIPGRDVVIC